MKWVSSQSIELLDSGIIQKNAVDHKKDCGKHFSLEGTFIIFLWKKKSSCEDLNFLKKTDAKTMKIIFIFPQEPTSVSKPKNEDITTYKADNDRFTDKYLNCRILSER